MLILCFAMFEASDTLIQLHKGVPCYFGTRKQLIPGQTSLRDLGHVPPFYDDT